MAGAAGAWGGSMVARITGLVKETYPSICHICTKDIPDDEYSVDHLIPRSKGGTNDIENLRPAHKICNSSRGNKDIETYRPTIVDETAWFLSL